MATASISLILGVKLNRKTNREPTPVNAHCHTAIVNTLWSIVAGNRFNHDDPELHHLIHLTSSAVRLRYFCTSK